MREISKDVLLSSILSDEISDKHLTSHTTTKLCKVSKPKNKPKLNGKIFSVANSQFKAKLHPSDIGWDLELVSIIGDITIYAESFFKNSDVGISSLYSDEFSIPLKVSGQNEKRDISKFCELLSIQCPDTKARCIITDPQNKLYEEHY